MRRCLWLVSNKRPLDGRVKPGHGVGEGDVNPIVARLEREGNIYAEVHAAEVAAFHIRERLRRMEILLRDLREEAEVRGDLLKLEEGGVSLGVVDDGHIVFRHGERMLDLIACETMSVLVGGAVVYPNRDCPVLDPRCYNEIMGLVFAWAGATK